MESIKAMLESMGTDTAFEAEIRQLVKDGKTSDLVAAAAAKGFKFTQDDWQKYVDGDMPIQPAPHGSGQTLNEEDLESVAGGGRGTEDNPHRSGECWYIGAVLPKEPFREPRFCLRISCVKWLDAEHGPGWYSCGCFNTGNCRGRHHVTGGSCTE